MESNLGEFLRAERLKQGLSLGQLACMVGYRNLNKGARRLGALERTGTGKADLVVNVAQAMNLDWTVVEQLIEQDYQGYLREWRRWVSEPIPMHLVVRLMATVYSRKNLPAWVTTPEQAEAWACEFAREHRLRACLVLSRRQSVWIDASGQVEERTTAAPDHPNIPFKVVAGRITLPRRAETP